MDSLEGRLPTSQSNMNLSRKARARDSQGTYKKLSAKKKAEIGKEHEHLNVKCLRRLGKY